MPNAYQLSEIDHRYGPNVHILNDPFLTTQLARLCSPQTQQPLFNHLISLLYTSLIRAVINVEFPRVAAEIPTRMLATNRNGVFRGEVIETRTPTVAVPGRRPANRTSPVLLFFHSVMGDCAVPAEANFDPGSTG